MTTTQVRVPGGGNTYICVGEGDNKVEFLSSISDTPGSAVGNPTTIHPIGSKYPVEIATGYAQGAGTLRLEVWQLWGKDGWVTVFGPSGIFEGYSPANNTYSNDPIDLVQVLEAQRQANAPVVIKKVELGADGNIARIINYKNAVITNIGAQENVRIETMERKVTIDVMYTHTTVSK